ncbi:hypothetical protein MNBD_GAMMA25-1618 [hydrothermal vent metagenome]|uniref:Doubled CXXCH motif domain-containing protein n=1 Tax=hydrothermal vent metagenome TaxID=652676 RepID=A0A3B1AZH0_9ZZZZ
MNIRILTIPTRVVAAILLAGISIVPAGAVGHNLCSDCHINANPTSLTAELIRPLPFLCQDCHIERTGRNEHVTDVIPSMIIPQDLPLLNGQLSCTTCHDPHASTSGQLRYPNGQLCITCHRK